MSIPAWLMQQLMYLTSLMNLITTFMTSFSACGSCPWLGWFMSLQACQLFMTNTFMNAHELLVTSLC